MSAEREVSSMGRKYVSKFKVINEDGFPKKSTAVSSIQPTVSQPNLKITVPNTASFPRRAVPQPLITSGFQKVVFNPAFKWSSKQQNMAGQRIQAGRITDVGSLASRKSRSVSGNEHCPIGLSDRRIAARKVVYKYRSKRKSSSNQADLLAKSKRKRESEEDMLRTRTGQFLVVNDLSIRRIRKERHDSYERTAPISPQSPIYPAGPSSATYSPRSPNYPPSSPNYPPANLRHCPDYCRRGYCNGRNRGDCIFVHDRQCRSICPSFVRQECEKTSETCLLSHEITPDKMPLCGRFLDLACHSLTCPFVHVKHSATTPRCVFFDRGYCPNGWKCNRKHLIPKWWRVDKETTLPDAAPEAVPVTARYFEHVVPAGGTLPNFPVQNKKDSELLKFYVDGD